MFYLQSVCPTPAPLDRNVPPLMRLLLAPAESVSPFVAVLGLLAVTALVLTLASQTVKRLEINYSTD